jgi:hypothetical protein
MELKKNLKMVIFLGSEDKRGTAKSDTSGQDVGISGEL